MLQNLKCNAANRTVFYKAELRGTALKVGRCKFTVSKPELKALGTKTWTNRFQTFPFNSNVRRYIKEAELEAEAPTNPNTVTATAIMSARPNAPGGPTFTASGAHTSAAYAAAGSQGYASYAATSVNTMSSLGAAGSHAPWGRGLHSSTFQLYLSIS